MLSRQTKTHGIMKGKKSSNVEYFLKMFCTINAIVFVLLDGIVGLTKDKLPLFSKKRCSQICATVFRSNAR